MVLGQGRRRSTSSSSFLPFLLAPTALPRCCGAFRLRLLRLPAPLGRGKRQEVPVRGRRGGGGGRCSGGGGGKSRSDAPSSSSFSDRKGPVAEGPAVAEDEPLVPLVAAPSAVHSGQRREPGVGRRGERRRQRVQRLAPGGAGLLFFFCCCFGGGGPRFFLRLRGGPLPGPCLLPGAVGGREPGRDVGRGLSRGLAGRGLGGAL